MPHRMIGSRWLIPRRQYSGSWKQNPWINVASRDALARNAALGAQTVSVSAECFVDSERAAAPNRSSTDVYDAIENRQQKSAIRTWENEGGNTGSHPSVRR